MSAFLRYLVVGGLALLLHLAILQGLLLLACVPWLASAIGFVAACALNYTLQRLWVFRSGRSHAIVLPRYLALTTFMLGVNTVLFSTLFNIHVPPLAAQTIATGCVFVLNFFGNRYFTFGRRRSVTPSA